MDKMSDNFEEWWEGYMPPCPRNRRVAEDAWTAAMQFIFNPRFKEGQKIGEYTVARRWSVNGQWFYSMTNSGDWRQDELVRYQRAQSAR